MADIVLRLFSLTLYALVWLFLVFTDYLDWHGRMEVLEAKHPQVAKLVQSRPLRLVLLLTLLGLLIGDFRDTMKQVETEPFVVKLSVPNADAGAKNAEIARLKTKVAPIEMPDSLRHQIWRLADQIEQFWVVKQRDLAPSPPGEDQRTSSQRMMSWQETSDRECKNKFNDKVRELVHKLDAKGVDSRAHGWLDFSVILNQRCLNGDELFAFRELSYKVDAQDNKVSPAP